MGFIDKIKNSGDYVYPTEKITLKNYKDQIRIHKMLNMLPFAPENILIFGFFGSAIKEPIYKTKKHKFLFWNWEEKNIIYTANDVDCLIITKDKKQELLTLSLPIIYKRYYDDFPYGFDWIETEKPGALHLLVTTLKKIRMALKNNDADAKRIISELKLCMGYKNILEELKRLHG